MILKLPKCQSEIVFKRYEADIFSNINCNAIIRFKILKVAYFETFQSRDLPSTTKTTTRMPRATSYDPFASTNRASSVIRSGGLSNSDYTPRISSYTSRWVLEKFDVHWSFQFSKYIIII